MRNIKLTLEFIGTNYYGFQRQKNLPTIQGELEKALSIILREKIKVIGAGRTDAGAHALAYIVNFLTGTQMTIDELVYRANAVLPNDITIIEADEVSLDFDARRNALWREYEYYILNRPYPSAFFRHFTHHICKPLNLRKMKEVSSIFLGKHDFSAFCADASSYKSCVREVLLFEVKKKGDFIVFRVRANAFLYNMVRTMVGTLIKVGEGTLNIKKVKEILESRDRRKAPQAAPAHALFLTQISYPK